jgi:hypothetical protein
MPISEILKCRRLLPQDASRSWDEADIEINAAEQILDFASVADRRWDCYRTLVILTSDEKQWNRAAQRFPKPAGDIIELSSLRCCVGRSEEHNQ